LFDFKIQILGFHPYKEILFLSRAEEFHLNATAFACHLNSFKVESLGSIYPTDYDSYDINANRDICAFPYTPMYCQAGSRLQAGEPCIYFTVTQPNFG
jgi:hypothetical protein